MAFPNKWTFSKWRMGKVKNIWRSAKQSANVVCMESKCLCRWFEWRKWGREIEIRVFSWEALWAKIVWMREKKRNEKLKREKMFQLPSLFEFSLMWVINSPWRLWYIWYNWTNVHFGVANCQFVMARMVK